MIYTKSLLLDPLKCTGCRECEVACALRHAGKNKCTRSRIQVLTGDTDAHGFFLPVTCQQCVNPPCMAACPKNAIYRNEGLDRVVLDESRCVGCKMCVSACPSGAMGFDAELGLAYKCDHCDGDPECVRVCGPKAIEYTGDDRLQHSHMMESATKLFHVVRTQIPLA